jgi:DNA-binding transcriptional LysR family regulator
MIYFDMVAEVLSIRECARRLNVASSAVSRQISQLEDALGMALFQRDGRKMRLTTAGEILYRHVRRLSSPLEAAVSELDMLRGLKTGSVRVAAVESIGLSFLPQLLASFQQRYPTIHLDVTVTSSSEVITQLVEEQADIGFGFLIKPSPEIEMIVRRDVRIGVLMRPDHPLAETENLTLNACFAHPVAVGKRELSIREAIQPLLDGMHSARPPLLEVGSIRILVELALLGHHVAIMTPIGAHNEIAGGELIFKPLQDARLPINRFGVMVRSSANLHFAPAVFYDHARQHFQSVELPGAV